MIKITCTKALGWVGDMYSVKLAKYFEKYWPCIEVFKPEIWIAERKQEGRTPEDKKSWIYSVNESRHGKKV